jgi:hypothetical protein
MTLLVKKKSLVVAFTGPYQFDTARSGKQSSVQRSLIDGGMQVNTGVVATVALGGALGVRGNGLEGG